MGKTEYYAGWQVDGLCIRTASGHQVAIVKHQKEVLAAIEKYEAEKKA